MGTLTGTNILAIARSVSNMDTTRWSDADVLPLLNEALRDLVMLLPIANTTRATPTLVAGTRQTLAGLGLTTGMQFIDFVRNFDAGGTVPGFAIRRVPDGRAFLDAFFPNWHNDAASATIRHFFTDEADPTAAYVWPQANGTGKAEIIYSALPAPFASLGAAISVDDQYANAVGYLLVARMHQRNEPGTLSWDAAQQFRGMAAQLLGVKMTTTKLLDRSKDEGV